MKKLENKKCIYCEQTFTPRIEKATLCSKSCMYAWRKDQNWITKKCLHCDKDFKAGYNVQIIWENLIRNKSFFRMSDYL